MLFASIKNTLNTGFERIKETFFLAEEKALASLPEPYIPTAEEIAAMPEKLREKAAKALHGPDANPSQLGDPTSLKAEQSDNVPKPEENGASAAASSSSSSSPSPKSSGSQGPGRGNTSERVGETLREKATKKLNGPDANPSQLGDPTSLKAEQSDNVPTPDAEGSKKNRDSKL